MSNPFESVTHDLIPGGAHTYSKGDDQFPLNAPRYLERGEGYRVWDRDGREFVDWSMGLRSMSLGYGVKEPIEAAVEQMWKGSNFGRPSYIETEFAQELVDHIPSAEMVKFAKNGSTVTSAAIKLARAHTGRDMVALCKDHPFFSYDDWFIGTTPMDGGIPDSEKSLSKAFRYNDLESLKTLFAENPGRIAAVIMEAATVSEPAPGFLMGVQELCREHGTVLVLDEMITGFRWHAQGAQAYYGLDPDLCTFGKGMANGFSVAFLAGKREIMELGGIREEGARRVFLISTTHGAENHALAAGRAVLEIFRLYPVVETMWTIGHELVEGLKQATAATGVSEQFEVLGYPCSPLFVCKDADGMVSMPLRTLFLQEIIERGVFMPYVAPSWSHDAEAVAKTVEAAAGALAVYARALDGGVEKFLRGPVVKPVFRAVN